MFTISDIQNVLRKEGNNSIYNIVQNIYRNNANASGRSAKTLHNEVDFTTLSIYGTSYTPSIQRGTSPSVAQGIPYQKLVNRLYVWSFEKDLYFRNRSERYRFAINSARKMQSQGSYWHRSSSKRDIYTTEANNLTQRISEQIGDLIINTKIIQ